MNISKFRNSYLIDKTYRLTLVSVTLTALTPLFATLVDGLFSSNLLGNDALYHPCTLRQCCGAQKQ